MRGRADGLLVRMGHRTDSLVFAVDVDLGVGTRGANNGRASTAVEQGENGHGYTELTCDSHLSFLDVRMRAVPPSTMGASDNEAIAQVASGRALRASLTRLDENLGAKRPGIGSLKAGDRQCARHHARAEEDSRARIRADPDGPRHGGLDGVRPLRGT